MAALWMAPEVRRGHEYNLSADLFSFGVMLFEILEVALPLWDSQVALDSLTRMHFRCCKISHLFPLARDDRLAVVYIPGSPSSSSIDDTSVLPSRFLAERAACPSTASHDAIESPHHGHCC